MKTVGGTPYYDRDKSKMELADDMSIGDMSVTFKLKRKATFQDGTPVTAKDVKWSLDRAVTVGGFPTFQMGAGSLTKAEQFVVIDDHTIRVDFLRKDRLTVPDLAVIVPAIYNSELVKKSPTPSLIRRSWTGCCSDSPSRCSARPPADRPKWPGRRRICSRLTSRRPNSSWPKRTIRTASRPRSPSTSALPASTSRSA